MKTLPECYPASFSCTTRLTIFTIGTFLGLSLVVACSDFMVILIGPLLLLCCCCGWTDTDHHDTTTDEWQYYFETLKIIILFTPHHHHGQNAVCGLYEVLTVDQQWSGATSVTRVDTFFAWLTHSLWSWPLKRSFRSFRCGRMNLQFGTLLLWPSLWHKNWLMVRDRIITDHFANEERDVESVLEGCYDSVKIYFLFLCWCHFVTFSFGFCNSLTL